MTRDPVYINGIDANDLKTHSLRVPENRDLHTIIDDAKRFTLYHRSIIEASPLQIYPSALVFSPEKELSSEVVLRPDPAVDLSVKKTSNHLPLVVNDA